jgi:transcriptional regulator GlxA family with amidase domain
MLAYDGCQLIDVTGVLEIFVYAADLLRQRYPDAPPFYSVEILAERKGHLKTSSGIKLVADRCYRDAGEEIDTLLVAGGNLAPLYKLGRNQHVTTWLQGMAGRVRRIGSICTGVHLLAEAGLLEGRRATTHWAFCDTLANNYQNTEVCPDAIHIRDGQVYTSAGATAGMDLALDMVEADLGREVSLAVARFLVMFLKRPGGQSQFSGQLAMQLLEGGRLSSLLHWIANHLADDLTLEVMAAQVHVSPRNLHRMFLREVGTTPARFVEALRVEEARRRLEDCHLPCERIATDCGFRTEERMRRSFKRKLHTLPESYRRSFGGMQSANNMPTHRSIKLDRSGSGR